MVRDCVKLHGVLGGSRLANHILLYLLGDSVV